MLLHLKLHTGTVLAARIEVGCFILGVAKDRDLSRFDPLAMLCWILYELSSDHFGACRRCRRSVACPPICFMFRCCTTLRCVLIVVPTASSRHVAPWRIPHDRESTPSPRP